MPLQAKRDKDTSAPAFIGQVTGSAASGMKLRQDGPVSYIDASGLGESMEMPRSESKRLRFIVLVAILLSAAVIVAYNVTVMGDIQKTRDQVTAVISRDVSLDLPSLKDYAGKTNEAMLSDLKAAGYTIYDNSNDEDRNVDGFDVFKLASDIDADDAATAYSHGIENLSAVEAAKYLKGSWRFLVNRSQNAELRLRYADFDATDPVSAIQTALESQGFDDANIADVAEDTMGNTNLSGTFKKDKIDYEYTISACDLSQVYDIDGAPENAQFVGIRVSVATDA